MTEKEKLLLWQGIALIGAFLLLLMCCIMGRIIMRKEASIIKIGEH